MSVPKIKRLRTPERSVQSVKQSDSTMLSQACGMQQSTITLIKSVQCSQSLQVALINEINQVYKEVTNLKQERRKLEHSNRDLTLLAKDMETQIKKLSQDLNAYQEMYQLEMLNHMQLRKFYEQRQLEWKFIVDQHRQILEQYDRKHSTNYSKIVPEAQKIPLDSSLSIDKSENQSLRLESSVYCSQGSISSSLRRRGRNNLRKSSLERNNSSCPKLKLHNEKDQEEYFFREVSRLYKEESRFTQKSKLTLLDKDLPKMKSGHKNAQVDDFFESVLRRTYYKYKQKCISVAQIESTQDMKKLKNANTSTKERLIKTIKKLNFELSDEQEITIFCDYVEKAVLDRYHILKGDFVFQLLIEKLKQCEKLALSSDSALQRFDKEKSKLNQQNVYLDSNKTENSKYTHIPSDLKLYSKSHSQIEKMSQKNLSLLLDSTIKNDFKKRKYISSQSQWPNKNDIKGEGDSELVSRSEQQILSFRRRQKKD